MEIQQCSEDVIATIQAMNRCWTEGWNEDQFRQYLHPDVVAIVPTTPGRLEGRDAYVAGWRAFCEAAEIHEWRETDHRVQIYAGGKSAVVTYLFSITFVMGGQKWLIVADQYSPEPMQF